MPAGFVGNVAERYLTDVENALEAAAVVHSRDPLIGVPTELTGRPALPTPVNETPPYPASTAHNGGHTTGVGNSSNIVVNRGTYSEIMQEIDSIDQRVSEAMYNAAVALEQL